MDELLTLDACTLPSADRPVRLSEFDDVFRRHVRAVQRDGDVVRLVLRRDVGLGEQLRDLAARGSNCCSFFTFTITEHDEDITLTISVPPSQRAILVALYDRAAELSSLICARARSRTPPG